MKTRWHGVFPAATTQFRSDQSLDLDGTKRHLEALVQAAAWLLHLHHGFAKSVAVLKEARNVKYGQFVAPGDALIVDVQCIKYTDTGATFKATGTVAGVTAVTARLELAYFNLADKQPNMIDIDRRLIEHNRVRWALIDPQGSGAPKTPEPKPLTI